MGERRVVKLICSAATKADLEQMINRYYYSESYRIQEDNTVFNVRKNAALDGVAVEEKRGRWRFGFM